MEPLKSYDPKEHPFELRHEVKRLNSRLDSISHLLEKAEFKDIIENYADPKSDYLQTSWLGYHVVSGLV